MLRKLFDPTYKEFKKCEKLADKVLLLEEEFKALSNEELQAKTKEFRTRLENGETLDDILVEAFFEIFSEGFIALCSAFIPQKVVSEKRKKIIGYVCLAISLILLVGLFAGIIILVETKGQSFWGWLLISLNIIYLLAGIALKIISHIKK